MLEWFFNDPMVSSYVRWLYCCNPANPIVVSVPHAHTHTSVHTIRGAQTHTLAVCCCHLKHSGNPPAYPTWNTHDALIHAETTLHTHRRLHTAGPNTGQELILSIHSCVACEGRQTVSYTWANTVLCFNSLHIYSSEDRTKRTVRASSPDSQGFGFSWTGARRRGRWVTGVEV